MHLFENKHILLSFKNFSQKLLDILFGNKNKRLNHHLFLEEYFFEAFWPILKMHKAIFDTEGSYVLKQLREISYNILSSIIKCNNPGTFNLYV